MISVVRILLVEDFMPWHRVVSTLLETNTALQIVSAATDGLEGIVKAQELQPDVVLLDIGLPGLNGIEVARHIRRVSSGSKILFLTENSCQTVMESALSTGACGYVLKSSAVHQLLPAVESIIAGSQFISQVPVSEGRTG